MGYLLAMKGMSPTRYLRDYRRGPKPLWTADAREAEPFARRVDADEMARRLAWVLRLDMEVLPSPDREDGQRCITLGCSELVAPGGEHCRQHLQPRRKPVVALTPEQIHEAALYRARQDARGGSAIRPATINPSEAAVLGARQRIAAEAILMRNPHDDVNDPCEVMADLDEPELRAIREGDGTITGVASSW